ncbi:MAG TPA: lytic transglycosylase domain-containing protein, partial [Hydrogenophaga sp.]|nr:lytic transglycosylase domain-containing protein [Hydrogenophaga sp.]
MKRSESPSPREQPGGEILAPNRRACLLAGLSGLAWSASSLLTPAAGGQLEEPLADSVRSALASAVANSAPPEPVFSDTVQRLAYLR